MIPRLPLALTRPGAALAGLTLLIVLAALNTGANLLFLVLGLVAGLAVVSLAAGGRLLRSLVLDLQVPALVEAGGTVPGWIRLRGRSGLVWIHGADLVPGAGVLAGAALGASRFVGTAPGRGVLRQLELELRTRHPFHLLERRLRVTLPVAVHVHPRLPGSAATDAIAAGSGLPRPEPGGGEALKGLRAYAPGDNPRHIHWRASARRWLAQDGSITAPSGGPGTPWVVREFHGEARAALEVQLDRTLPPGPAFEAEVERAAGAVDAALRAGREVRLLAGGTGLVFAGGADRSRALRWFAAVAPAGGPIEDDPRRAADGGGDGSGGGGEGRR